MFASDRDRRRDDRQFRSDAWVVPLSGGRPRRLTNGKGRVAFPLLSPDGKMVAFSGQLTESWDADNHVFVVPADGSAPAEAVAPDSDRPVPLFAGLPAPLCWIGERELAMLLADRGTVGLHRARRGERRSHVAVGGEIELDGFAARLGGRTVAFTAAWADRPSEVFIGTLGGDEPVQLSHLNDEFLAAVELAPVNHRRVRRSLLLRHPGRWPKACSAASQTAEAVSQGC